MAGLTAQHFKVIAEIINKQLMTDKNINQAVIWDLAEYFKTQNPLFNENRFKKACLE